MKRALFLLTAACLSLWSCHSRENLPQKQLGRGYYLNFNCNRCHRIGNSGGIDGPDLTMVGLRHSREWLDLWIKNPRAWKKDTVMLDLKVEDKTRQAIVEYLVSLKGEIFQQSGHPWDNARLTGDPVGRGQVIFERAGCAACHGKAGKGGFPNNNVIGGQIPSLTYAADGFTTEELKERIRRGRKPESADGAKPPALVEMPGWAGILKEKDIDDVAQYIFSLRPPKKKDDEW
ncbi:MAG: c-type cytochrome [Elusimicrobia bacterium]|nr:c-type cytochrome [Elusimicrobiota bacterium]